MRRVFRAYTPPFAFAAIFPALIIIPVLSGCGIRGTAPPDIGFPRPVLISGRMTQEGGADRDILFASVGGGNVTGGWIENPQGTKIPHSDLQFINVTNRYESLLTRSVGGFPPGAYALNYQHGGETREHKPSPLSWTALPRFSPAPLLRWDPNTRYLTVRFSAIPGASVRYFLRMYNPNTGFLRRETFGTDNTEIRELILDSGELQVMLVAEIEEGGSPRGRVLHLFQSQRF